MWTNLEPSAKGWKRLFKFPVEGRRKRLEGICKSFCINLKIIRLWAIVQWFVMVFWYIFFLVTWLDWWLIVADRLRHVCYKTALPVLGLFCHDLCKNVFLFQIGCMLGNSVISIGISNRVKDLICGVGYFLICNMSE